MINAVTPPIKTLQTYLRSLRSESLAGITDLPSIELLRQKKEEIETALISREPLLATTTLQELPGGRDSKITSNIFFMALKDQAEAMQEAAQEINRFRIKLQSANDNESAMEVLAKLTQLGMVSAWKLVTSSWDDLPVLSEIYQKQDILNSLDDWTRSTLWTLTCIIFFSVVFLFFITVTFIVGLIMFIQFVIGAVSAILLWNLSADIKSQYLRMHWGLVAGLGGDREKARELKVKYQAVAHEAIFTGVLTVVGSAKILASLARLGPAVVRSLTSILRHQTLGSYLWRLPGKAVKALWNSNLNAAVTWASVDDMIDAATRAGRDADEWWSAVNARAAANPSWAYSAKGQQEILAALAYRSGAFRTALYEGFENGFSVSGRLWKRMQMAVGQGANFQKVAKILNPNSLAHGDSLLTNQGMYDLVTEVFESLIRSRFPDPNLASKMSALWTQNIRNGVNANAGNTLRALFQETAAIPRAELAKRVFQTIGREAPDEFLERVMQNGFSQWMNGSSNMRIFAENVVLLGHFLVAGGFTIGLASLPLLGDAATGGLVYFENLEAKESFCGLDRLDPMYGWEDARMLVDLTVDREYLEEEKQRLEREMKKVNDPEKQAALAVRISDMDRLIFDTNVSLVRAEELNRVEGCAL